MLLLFLPVPSQKVTGVSCCRGEGSPESLPPPLLGPLGHVGWDQAVHGELPRPRGLLLVDIREGFQQITVLAGDWANFPLPELLTLLYLPGILSLRLTTAPPKVSND